jgi:putative phosphoribosyl transferase
MKFKNSNISGFFSNLKDGTAFQIRFRDRVGAGIALATALKFVVKQNKKNEEKILVLGIPRGGVIVADVVAQKMNAELGIIFVKKLSAPNNKENAIGAVMEDGSLYLDYFLLNSLKISKEYIEKEKQEQMQEIKRRKALYCPPLPSLSENNSNDNDNDNANNDNSKNSHHPHHQYRIKDRTVVLVDDGVATGATVIAAARWIRKQEPDRLIIAAPVAQPQAADLLKKEVEEADAIEIITTPSNFGSVNQFYQNFDQATDEKVIEILKDRKLFP